MIALSVLLPSKLNRAFNLTFASLLTVIVALVGATSISAWQSFYVMYAAIEIVITVSIIRIAWSWPKEEV